MKRASMLAAAALVVCTAGSIAGADEKKADHKFCAAVTANQSDVAELNAIGPHSTVAEVRAARTRIDEHVTQMQSAATKMKTPTAKRFLDATKQLSDDINNVPDTATLQQVQSKIQDDAQNAHRAGQQLAEESGCPQPEAKPPPREPHQP